MLGIFLNSIVDGTGLNADKTRKGIGADGNEFNYYLDEARAADGNFAIKLAGGTSAASGQFQHVGRVYDSGNLRSYQIVIDTENAVRADDDDGECVANNDCYESIVPGVASGAEMGILALINGLANPAATGSAYNTHGIAPGAQLDVITTLAVGTTGENNVDAIYRARGIDVAQDSGADDDRNIVIIQNGIASSTLTDTITFDRVNTHTTTGGTYVSIYETLQVGLNDDKKQDAYVFAARDGGAADVGILAALPVSTHGTSMAEYSIIVVAAESGQTQCGGNPRVRDICIAAPGAYKFRPHSGGVYATRRADGTATANAAASLVAGGLALLESIFAEETTARLIDRLLRTASKKFNLDSSTGANQYTLAKHGQGLMDLACAIRPAVTSGTLARTGCTDRYPTVTTGTFSPPQEPEPDPIPTGSAEGDKGEDDTAKSGVDYCDIDGLRIILSGDLCSSDYILLADKEGKLQPETIGNLRFGMGFGDALAGATALGGITFFDAFDTAWTVDNPYNPYAHLLDISNIVIAPAESRFDIDDRFLCHALWHTPRHAQKHGLPTPHA